MNESVMKITILEAQIEEFNKRITNMDQEQE
jgi:hypothetical protein